MSIIIIENIKWTNSKLFNLRYLIGVWILLALVLANGFSGQTQSFLIRNPKTYIKTFQELLQFARNDKNVKITVMENLGPHRELKSHGKNWPFKEILEILQNETSWSYFDIAMSVYNKSKIYIQNLKVFQGVLIYYNEFPFAISDELKSETLQGRFIVNKLNDGAFCQNATSFQYYCVKGIIDRENRNEIRWKIMKM